MGGQNMSSGNQSGVPGNQGQMAQGAGTVSPQVSPGYQNMMYAPVSKPNVVVIGNSGVGRLHSSERCLQIVNFRQR